MKQNTPVKKGSVRLGVILGLVALMVVAMVFVVGAAGENPFEGQTGSLEAYCEHCGETVTWIPLSEALTGTASTYSVSSGHYYLTENTTVTKEVAFTSGGTACLELNGFTLTRAGTVLGVSGATTVLNIFDSSTGKTGCIQNTATRNYGIEHHNGAINQYGGKIEAMKIAKKDGAAVYIDNANCKYTMYGGVMTAKSTKGTDSSGNTVGGNGGAVYILKGSFILNGGTIEDCSADVAGGAVYVAEAGTFEMKSGTIQNCSSYDGGAVYVNCGTFTMSGGTIQSCAASNTGGSAVLVGINSGGVVKKATMNMTGGTITNGTAYNGGNLEVRHVILTISGNAKVQNGVATAAGGNIRSTWTGLASITIKGNAEISGGKANNGDGGNIKYTSGSGLYIQENCTISGGFASETGGSIYTTQNVTMSGGTIDSSYAAKKGGSVFVAGNTFTMTGGTIQNGYCYGTQMGGNFCVESGSVKMSGGKVTGGTTRTAADTVTSKDAIPTAGYGGNFAMRGSTTLELSGTAEVSDGVTACGGNIWLQNNASLSIKDQAKISGGYATLGGNVNLSHPNGTNTQSVTMDGGTIENGHATNGGNVYIAMGSFTLDQGTVKGGVTTNNGGNFFLTGTASYIGTMIMNGGNVENGAAGNNTGGVRVNGYSKFELNGGVLSGNTGRYSGGSVAVAGTKLDSGDEARATFDMNGGTIQNGAATESFGGCLFLGNYADATLDDGTITGGTAYSDGGNIAIGGAISVTLNNMTISGGKVEKGWGGNIAIRDGGQTATLTLTGNTVIDGTDAHCNTGAYYGNNLGLSVSGAKVYFSENTVVKEGDANNRYSVALANGALAYLSDNANVDNLYIRTAVADGTVTLKAGYTGETKVRTQDNTVNAKIIPGQAVYGALVKESGYTGVGAMVRVVDASGTAYLTTLNASGTLITAGITGFTSNGKEVGLVDLSDSNQYAYIKLYADGTYTLTADTTVDLNNRKVTINTGSYRLSPIDYRSDDINEQDKLVSQLTVDNDNNVVVVTKNPVNGYRYVNIKAGDYWTSNRFELNIYKVSLKTSSDAVSAYYTTRILANKNLTPYLQDYGVAFSAAAMPNAGFASDDTVLYTSRVLTDTQKTEGVYTLVRSALLENILSKTGNGSGEDTYYVNAYATFTLPGSTEDLVLMAESERTHTLKALVKKLDAEQFVDAAESVQNAIVTMYGQWLVPMANWNLENISAAYAASQNNG